MGFRSRVWGLGFSWGGFGPGAWGLWLKIWGLGLRVSEFGFGEEGATGAKHHNVLDLHPMKVIGWVGGLARNVNLSACSKRPRGGTAESPKP